MDYSRIEDAAATILQGSKMDLQSIQFAVGTGKGESVRSNRSDLVNLYPHFESVGSKSPVVLLNTEGTKKASADTASDILGLYEFKGLVYLALRDRIVSWNGREFTEIAGVAEEVYFYQDRVFIADNGSDIMFVGAQGFSYNPETLVFTVMSTVAGWYPATTVAYLDGYFIFNRKGTGQFFISKLYSIELNPLDWATGEAAPDDTRAVVVAGRELWIMGTRSTEIWYDSGDRLFPFQRIPGAVTDIGIANADTIGRIHNSIFFVGNDYKVYSTSGYEILPISNTSIELLIDESNVRKFMAFTYYNNGHYFYVLHLSEYTTVVYDAVTGLWHRRVSCTDEQDPLLDGGRWKINGAINRYDKQTIYGYSARSFYELSTNFYTDDGVKIRREAVTMPLNKTPNHVTLAEIQVDMESGAYDNTLISNYEIWLQLSGDDGRSWGNRRIGNIGKRGQYTVRARWQRLGQHRDVIGKVVITDPMPICLLGLWARS